ncbi:MAG: hypothetical protein HRT36_05455, partial [Alphaproteobacteria bacterium]|nr:hypothetical protein [Alphaproteobacteria bacterium]
MSLTLNSSTKIITASAGTETSATLRSFLDTNSIGRKSGSHQFQLADAHRIKLVGTSSSVKSVLTLKNDQIELTSARELGMSNALFIVGDHADLTFGEISNLSDVLNNNARPRVKNSVQFVIPQINDYVNLISSSDSAVPDKGQISIYGGTLKKMTGWGDIRTRNVPIRIWSAVLEGFEFWDAYKIDVRYCMFKNAPYVFSNANGIIKNTGFDGINRIFWFSGSGEFTYSGLFSYNTTQNLVIFAGTSTITINFDNCDFDKWSTYNPANTRRVISRYIYTFVTQKIDGSNLSGVKVVMKRGSEDIFDGTSNTQGIAKNEFPVEHTTDYNAQGVGTSVNSYTIRYSKYGYVITEKPFSTVKSLENQINEQRMLVESTITETDSTVVAAYTTVSNSAQLNDSAHLFQINNYSSGVTPIVTLIGIDLDFGSKNITLDPNATSVFALSGSSITVKTTATFTGNITTTGTITLANNVVVVGVLVDSQYNSTLTFSSNVSSWKVFSTDANRLSNTSPIGSGSGNYRFLYSAGTSYYLKLTLVGSGSPRYSPPAITPTSSGETSVNISVDVLVAALSSALDAISINIQSIKTDATTLKGNATTIITKVDDGFEDAKILHIVHHSNLDADTATIKTDVATIKTDVSTVKSDVDTIKTEAASIIAK